VIIPIFTFFSAAVISLLVTFPVIWLLQVWHLGQPVRAEGPASHQAKSGTLTMGGIGFILVILAMTVVLIDLELYPQYLALFLLTLAFAIIGLADDACKVFFRRNLGLTFWQKIALQGLVAAVFAIVMTLLGHNLTLGGWLGRYGFANPYLYQLLVIFLVVGGANATNLTDGLNGLLAGTASVAFLVFGILAWQMNLPQAVTFALVCSGAVTAFLYFNFPQARVFMGDVGSLALGAALAGLAVIMHRELRLAVIGGIFVIEALSVIIQVGSYKLFKKRVFKMSPLHHHFELMGIKETTVVVGFWVVGIVLAIIGLWI